MWKGRKKGAFRKRGKLSHEVTKKMVFRQSFRWDIGLKDYFFFFFFVSLQGNNSITRYSSSIPRGSNGIMERLAFDLIRKGKHDRIQGDWQNVVYANFNRIRSLIAISSCTNRKKSGNSPPISIRESKFRNGWIRIWYVINRDTLLSSLIFFPFRESEFVRIDKNRDLKLFLFLSIIISRYEKNN